MLSHLQTALVPSPSVSHKGIRFLTPLISKCSIAYVSFSTTTTLQLFKGQNFLNVFFCGNWNKVKRIFRVLALISQSSFLPYSQKLNLSSWGLSDENQKHKDHLLNRNLDIYPLRNQLPLLLFPNFG